MPFVPDARDVVLNEAALIELFTSHRVGFVSYGGDEDGVAPRAVTRLDFDMNDHFDHEAIKYAISSDRLGLLVRLPNLICKCRHPPWRSRFVCPNRN